MSNLLCDNCGYEKNPDDALSCSLCGKVFRKEKAEDREKGRFVNVKKTEEPEKDKDFLDHDGPADYRNVIQAFKKLRKRSLNAGEVCLLSTVCGCFLGIIYGLLSHWGIIPVHIPNPNNLIAPEIIFALMIPLITLSIFFMKKSRENILSVLGILVLAIIVTGGSRIFEKITGWRSEVPQLVPWYSVIILLLSILIGIIGYKFWYKFLRRRE